MKLYCIQIFNLIWHFITVRRIGTYHWERNRLISVVWINYNSPKTVQLTYKVIFSGTRKFLLHPRIRAWRPDLGFQRWAPNLFNWFSVNLTLKTFLYNNIYQILYWYVLGFLSEDLCASPNWPRGSGYFSSIDKHGFTMKMVTTWQYIVSLCIIKAVLPLKIGINRSSSQWVLKCVSNTFYS